MRRGREATHIGAALSQDHLRGDRPDPGNGVEPGHRGCQLAELGVNPVLHDGDVGGDAVDPLQHLGQQGRVVLGEPAGQRLGQAIGLGPQRPRASSASTAGSRSPAISAAMTARPRRRTDR
jgi:hypothetical protein